jgi:hypothetical protein
VTFVTSTRVTHVTGRTVTRDTRIRAAGGGPSGHGTCHAGKSEWGEVTIVAEKKISPRAPAAKGKKESGKTEAATRVTRMKRIKRIKRIKR